MKPGFSYHFHSVPDSSRDFHTSPLPTYIQYLQVQSSCSLELRAGAQSRALSVPLFPPTAPLIQYLELRAGAAVVGLSPPVGCMAPSARSLSVPLPPVAPHVSGVQLSSLVLFSPPPDFQSSCRYLLRSATFSGSSSSSSPL